MVMAPGGNLGGDIKQIEWPYLRSLLMPYVNKNPLMAGGPYGAGNVADGQICAEGWRNNLGVGASFSSLTNTGGALTLTHTDGGGGLAGHSSVVSKVNGQPTIFSWAVILNSSTPNFMRCSYFDDSVSDGTTKAAGTGGTNLPAIYGAGLTGGARFFTESHSTERWNVPFW